MIPLNSTEALIILATLKAAYPDSYKYVNKDEAAAIANVWAKHFIDIPFDLIEIAVDKWVHIKEKPPTISELRKQIGSLYWEAYEELRKHKTQNHLTADEVKYFERMKEITSKEMYRPEPLTTRQIAQYERIEHNQNLYLLEGN